MAFSDPQSITIDSNPVSLPKTSPGANSTIYQAADESLKLRISHQESKGRTRRMVRLDQRVVAANPLTAVNEYKTAGVYIVIDEPEYGFDDTALSNLATGLIDFLTGSNVAKVLGGEH